MGKCIAKKATIKTEARAISESGFDLRCERPALIVPALDSKSISLTFSNGFLKNQIMIEEKRNKNETIKMTVYLLLNECATNPAINGPTSRPKLAFTEFNPTPLDTAPSLIKSVRCERRIGPSSAVITPPAKETNIKEE